MSIISADQEKKATGPGQTYNSFNNSENKCLLSNVSTMMTKENETYSE